MSVSDRDREYLEGVHAPMGPVLEEMLTVGRAENIPILQPSAGRVLRALVMAASPTRVLEIGTAIGFSTLWMATALHDGARIDTIDPDRARTDRARRYWLRAGVTDKVRVVNEPALRVLPRLAPGIEFAFIDAIKAEYTAYLDALVPKAKAVRVGSGRDPQSDMGPVVTAAARDRPLEMSGYERWTPWRRSIT